MKFQNQGVSLYLAMIIMAVVLSLALGTSAISLGQTKVLKEMGNSVFSFYAAESGVERALFEWTQGAAVGSHYEDSLANGAVYSADIMAPGEIKSTGSYKNTKRAIQITR